ncbi:hypothetical protein VPHD51_0198 [Vibrio phage D51]
MKAPETTDPRPRGHVRILRNEGNAGNSGLRGVSPGL